MKRIYKNLKNNGLFFSYFPCKKSDAFVYKCDAEYIDSDTLSGITRVDSPFFGNHYNFRFLHPEEYKRQLEDIGFVVQYCELVTKTYNNNNEKFSHIVIEARKETDE